MLKLVKPDKNTGTSTDTILITRELVKEWQVPPFQRAVRTNSKVLALAQEFKTNDGVFPGVLTIGVLKGVRYIVDGQHRLAAFALSEVAEGYSDVRFRHYASMTEMAEDFVLLNSVLVKMRPDDILRGLESSNTALGQIRRDCPFVGYDHIRRGTTSPILSMSALLRCWSAAGRDIPAASGCSAVELTKSITTDDAEQITTFLALAVKAWGRDPEYSRLWSNLNLTLSLWIYLRCVRKQWSARAPKITREQFVKMLSALSADTGYLEWLVGRQLSERDRSPAYRRVKTIFVKRLSDELGGAKVVFPQPEWVAN